MVSSGWPVSTMAAVGAEGRYYASREAVELVEIQ